MNSNVKVLLGDTLIDGTGRAPIKEAAILIANGRIESITKSAARDWPSDAEVIDFADKTILPGLIDCHDHFALHGSDVATRWGLNEPQSTRILRTAQILSRTLDLGYTTVRDAGGLDAGFKRAIAENLIPGPRLIVSLGIISPSGGIGDPTSPSGHCCVGLDPLLPNCVADGVSQVRSVVRGMVRAGADVVKCATTGGASSRLGHGPRDHAFNADEIEALVDEAHSLDRRVMCHALGGLGLRAAIEKGVNSIEHGCYLDETPDLIKKMADDGIFLVPTFTVYDLHRRFGAIHSRERAEALQQHHVLSVQKALESGVRIAAGTDGGMHGHPCNSIELEHLTAAGLSTLQALRAATGWAAECLGMEQDIGTVERGKIADLIVVSGDPIADITVLQTLENIKAVIQSGILVKQSPAAEEAVQQPRVHRTGRG